MKVVVSFCADIPVSSGTRMIKVSRSSLTDYYDNLRGEWYDNLQSDPITFEENGEYEVDE